MLGALFQNDNIPDPDNIARKRDIARALLAQTISSTPQNINEGILNIGRALIYRKMMNDVNGERAKGVQSANNVFSALTRDAAGGAPPTPVQNSPDRGQIPPTSTSLPMPSMIGGQAPQPMIRGQAPQPQNFAGDQQGFIKTILPAAMQESERTGVDPRIIVAQAAQESGWGKHAPGNNYFGIKSHGMPGGQDLKTTEFTNGNKINTVSSFRAYDSPEDSVHGYGDFILQNPRYSGLRQAKGLDAQLAALGSSGYATDPNYAKEVGSIARRIPLPTPQGQQDQQDMQQPGGNSVLASLLGYQGRQSSPRQPSSQVSRSNAAMTDAIKVLTNPYATAQQKMVAQNVYNRQFQASDPLRQLQIKKLQSEIQKQSATAQSQYDQRRAVALQYGLKEGSPDYQRFVLTGKMNNPPLVNVNTGENSNEFIKQSDKDAAERLNDIVKKGQDAQSLKADMEQLEYLGKNLNTGKRAEVLSTVGPWLKAIGVNVTDKLPLMQAYTAVINRIAPRMRVPGAGTSSDRDIQIFTRSLPNLSNTPEGNRIINDTFKGIYQNQINAAKLASSAQRGDMRWQDADEKIRNLPDPFEEFRKFQQNGPQTPQTIAPVQSPQMPQTIAPAGVSPQSSGSGPAIGAVMNGYMFKGGNPSDPKNWSPVNG